VWVVGGLAGIGSASHAAHRAPICALHIAGDTGKPYQFHLGAAQVLTLEVVPLCWAATANDHSTQRRIPDDLD